jgi:hypothetical protein
MVCGKEICGLSREGKTYRCNNMPCDGSDWVPIEQSMINKLNSEMECKKSSQDKPQPKSQDKPQNKSQDKPQDKPQTKAQDSCSQFKDGDKNISQKCADQLWSGVGCKAPFPPNLSKKLSTTTRSQIAQEITKLSRNVSSVTRVACYGKDQNEWPAVGLINGDTLLPGQAFTSPNGKYQAIYQANGGFAILNTSNNEVVSQIINPLVESGNEENVSRFVLANDGGLCPSMKDGSVVPCFATTATQGIVPYRLVMQNDRNLCLYDASNKMLWSSDTKI